MFGTEVKLLPSSKQLRSLVRLRSNVRCIIFTTRLDQHSEFNSEYFEFYVKNRPPQIPYQVMVRTNDRICIAFILAIGAHS